MGGLVLDIYIIYLAKVLIRVWKQRGCNNWPTMTAVVNYSDGEAGGSLYPTSVITYTYDARDQTFEGRNEKPFIHLGSAKRYTAHYSEGKAVIIRVKPQQPEVSIMRDKDQRDNR